LTHRALAKGNDMDATEPIASPDSLQLLLTPRQAARSLAISPRTLWGMTARREIRHLRIGRLVRYAVSDLRQWIAANTEEVHAIPLALSCLANALPRRDSAD
jgi:excisionase family DNA binding protein